MNPAAPQASVGHQTPVFVMEGRPVIRIFLVVSILHRISEAADGLSRIFETGSNTHAVLFTSGGGAGRELGLAGGFAGVISAPFALV